ncbi:Protein CBG18590 [Caenorhabditis briggsae]|uniref:Protein CBG18590 n=1 Tax=Caenorhabditis briggsae TaxID=6238 RepID=A8XTN3_CAEBR|nr:Protein CBG18590 [Caenorhabditis briggsae]CAP36009.2 Protein CBG18590 [Caenorhabditis briggsae]
MLYEIFHFWHIMIGVIGCCANLLLCYVAVQKTPPATRSYAILIINFAVTDFLECFLDLFIMLRFVITPFNVTLIYVYHGWCQYTGPLSCKIGQKENFSLSLFYHCFPHTTWSLLLSFSYRYYILHKSPLSRKWLILIVFIIYTPSLFQAIIYWPTVVDREEILPLATKFFPEYHLESEKSGILGGITTINEFASIYVIIHMAVPIFPIYCLIIQAFIPSLLMIGVTCYILSQLGLITHPFIEYLIFASICTMPMLSPFTYLVYIRPYRTFCMKLLHLQRKHRRYPNTDSNAYYSITRS